jgi:hypothetical protein
LIEHEVPGNAEKPVEVIAGAHLEISAVIQSPGIMAGDRGESTSDINREVVTFVLREGPIGEDEKGRHKKCSTPRSDVLPDNAILVHRKSWSTADLPFNFGFYFALSGCHLAPSFNCSGFRARPHAQCN